MVFTLVKMYLNGTDGIVGKDKILFHMMLCRKVQPS